MLDRGNLTLLPERVDAASVGQVSLCWPYNVDTLFSIIPRAGRDSSSR